MQRKRRPVEILRSRTLPMWPLWTLVIATPLLHWAWLVATYGVVTTTATTWDVKVHTEGAQSLAMMPVPEILAIGIAAPIWLAYRRNWRDVDRSSLMHHGWTYRAGSTPVPTGRFAAFPRPRRLFAGMTRCAWTAQDDYLCSSYTLWTSRVHRYSVERVELAADLPPVIVVPVDWFGRVANAVSFAPLAVESAEFNARWRVLSNEPRVASALLHPRMLAYLLSGAVPDDVGITIDDAAVLVWSPGRVNPLDIPARVAAARGVAALVPEFAFGQFGSPRLSAWGPGSMAAWSGTPEQSAHAQMAGDEKRGALPIGTTADMVALHAGTEREAYQAEQRARLEAEHPEWFRNGRRGYVTLILGGVAAMMLAIVWFATGVPVSLVAALVAAVGGTVIYVNARRIASAAVVDTCTAALWCVDPNPGEAIRI